MEEKFNVHIEFSSGDRMVERDKSLPQVQSAVQRLTRGPAAMGGLIKEVRVVDMFDRMVFHSLNNKILFPKR
tara:strand:+ start:306 stop:521 length:216 start_codon:yes stop_codon:yes gene_type:complete